MAGAGVGEARRGSPMPVVVVVAICERETRSWTG
jgi:hypothetical protein